MVMSIAAVGVVDAGYGASDNWDLRYAADEGYSSRDGPAVGTCSSQYLGQARSWDMSFKMLGTGSLLGQVLEHVWDRLVFAKGFEVLG